MKVRKTKKLSAKEVAKMRIENKMRWLVCSSSGCNEEVLVEEAVIKVKCSMCTTKMVPAPKIASTKPKSDKPAGWRFMAEFVDKDGNVFHFGEEQPKLKGTKKPSNVDKIREDQKKKREETKKKKARREKSKQERLVKQHEKAKKEKKKATDKKNGKTTKKKSSKKSSKKKNTNSAFKYEKFEENRIATDREQIQKFVDTEGIFAGHLQQRDININSIVKISRTSYSKIDTVTGDVKSKRRGYKVSLETGDVKIVNITVK